MATIVTWPSGLPQLVDQDSFAFGFGNTLLRSTNANGPDKIRRLMTKGTDSFTFSMIINKAQYSIIETFYKTTTNGGVYQFYFTHPITQAQIVLRFTKPPGFTALGGLVFKLAIDTEILPQ